MTSKLLSLETIPKSYNVSTLPCVCEEMDKDQRTQYCQETRHRVWGSVSTLLHLEMITILILFCMYLFIHSLSCLRKGSDTHHGHVGGGQGTTFGSCSFLLAFGFWGLNSGIRFGAAASPPPPEPSHWPTLVPFSLPVYPFLAAGTCHNFEPLGCPRLLPCFIKQRESNNLVTKFFCKCKPFVDSEAKVILKILTYCEYKSLTHISSVQNDADHLFHYLGILTLEGRDDLP